MLVDRSIFLALLDTISFKPKDIKFENCKDLNDLEKMKYICINLLMKYMCRQGSLKKDSKQNYCIIIDHINFYPEYAFSQDLMNDKNIKIMKILKKIMNDYLQGKFQIILSYENNNMLFFFYPMNYTCQIDNKES